MTLGRSKCIFKRDESGNTREVQFRGSCDLVSLMPIVSATGQIMTQLVILPVVEAKYRKRPNDKYDTASDLLPKRNYLHMKEIAGVDTNIFLEHNVLSKRRSCLLPRDLKLF